jgi:phytoene dehydrogenase-like protein
MARSTDVVILGAGFRGLWLATELVRRGWSVTWVELLTAPSNKRDGGFIFDDCAWQVGPIFKNSKMIQAADDFIQTVIRPLTQETAVQIVTKQGPLELSGGAVGRCLKKFFKETHKELESYLENVRASQKLDPVKGAQLLYVHTQKIFQQASAKRWVLEWLGGLRRPRAVDTKDWVLKWDGDVLDPRHEFWLLQDGYADIAERAISWAEKNGVKVKRGAKVADIGVQGRVVSGIEMTGAEGYLHCKYLVVACSHQTLQLKAVNFAKNVKAPVKQESKKWIWARCGFFLKPHSKPEGLLPFSSFVIDPLMPLTESNMGILRWNVTEKGDCLTHSLHGTEATQLSHESDGFDPGTYERTLSLVFAPALGGASF